MVNFLSARKLYGVAKTQKLSNGKMRRKRPLKENVSYRKRAQMNCQREKKKKKPPARGPRDEKKK